MAEGGKISMREAIGAALRFVRGNIGFVAAIAGAGAFAHVTLLGTLAAAPLLLLPGLAAVWALLYAALTRAALGGPGAVRATLVRDAGRVAGSGAMVWFFFAIVALLAAYGAMAILIAPYAEEARAVKDNEAALTQLMQRAITERPDVLFWSMVAGFSVLLLLTSRLFLTAPASVDRNRIVVFESWKLTRGNLLRIVGARVVLLAPALIFAGALQSLVGMGMGLGVADPIALAQSAQANPAAFMVFYGAAQFIQIAVYTALEAGLSAALYRQLSPAQG